jgi:hypothetical protein
VSGAASLLSGNVDPTGIMSLLAPAITSGAIRPPPGGMTPQQQAAATPAFLAFGQAMGQAAAPRYGPPVGLGPALANALGAGYGAAIQAEQLPLFQQSAQLSMEQRETALAQQQFEFGRQVDMWNAARGWMGGWGAGPGGAAPPAGGPGTTGTLNALTAPSASSADIAKLPEIQAISDPFIRLRMINIASDQGMSAPAAAQWARQIQVESGGRQYDPKTGAPITNQTSGTVGVGQVKPATFADMSKQYPDVGTDINDPVSNLRASAHYFVQGLHAANGDLAGTAAYYTGGPGGFTNYQQGNPDAATSDYIARTGALGAGGGGGTMGPMVQTPLGMVPQAIALQVQGAIAAAAAKGDPGAGIAAAVDIVTKWREGQYTQSGSTQTVAGTGQVLAAPVQPSTAPMSPDDRAKYFPNLPADVGTYWEVDQTGKRTPMISGGPRGAQIGYQRIDQQNDNVMNSAPMKQLQIAETYSRGVINGVNANNPVGDIAALESLFKVFDPAAAATEGKWNIASDIGGYRERFLTWWNKLQADPQTRLPPEVRDQIVQLMTNEMKSREGQVGNYITMTRGNYAGPPADANRIGVGWRPQYITSDDDTSDLPEGTVPSTTGWVSTPDASGVTKYRRGPLGRTAPTTPAPTTAVPPQAAGLPIIASPAAQTPQLPTPQATTGGVTPITPGTPALQPPARPQAQPPQQQQPRKPPQTDRLAGVNFDSMSAGDLAKIGDDIGRNPGNYSDADKQNYIAAARRSAQRALHR